MNNKSSITTINIYYITIPKKENNILLYCFVSVILFFFSPEYSVITFHKCYACICIYIVARFDFNNVLKICGICVEMSPDSCRPLLGNRLQLVRAWYTRNVRNVRRKVKPTDTEFAECMPFHWE